jgi:hypothetical protein
VRALITVAKEKHHGITENAEGCTDVAVLVPIFRPMTPNLSKYSTSTMIWYRILQPMKFFLMPR